MLKIIYRAALQTSNPLLPHSHNEEYLRSFQFHCASTMHNRFFFMYFIPADVHNLKTPHSSVDSWSSSIPRAYGSSPVSPVPDYYRNTDTPIHRILKIDAPANFTFVLAFSGIRHFKPVSICIMFDVNHHRRRIHQFVSYKFRVSILMNSLFVGPVPLLQSFHHR